MLRRGLLGASLACLLLAAPLAHAAVGPERLWEAYPLDPQAAESDGVTLAEPPPLPTAPPDSEGQAPPPAATGDADGGSPISVATIVGAGVLALGLLILVLGLWARRARRDAEPAASDTAEETVVATPSNPDEPASPPAVASRPASTNGATASAPPPSADHLARPTRSGALDSAPKKPAPPPEILDPRLHGIYTPAGALQFVSGLSDDVLGRAVVFFGLLANNRSVDSGMLADALGVQPRELPGRLLTPLRRRADAIDAPPPYEIGRSTDTGRRAWRDTGRVANTLLEAGETIQGARASTVRSTDAPSARAI